MKQWLTLTEYVSLETGEIITKSEKEREYYTVKKVRTIDTESNEKYNFIKWQYHCRRNGQLEIFK